MAGFPVKDAPHWMNCVSAVALAVVSCLAVINFPKWMCWFPLYIMAGTMVYDLLKGKK